MIGAGPVGLIGRNGWFVRERDVETNPAIAGWRGLALTEVRAWFNNTLFAFGTEGLDLETWGPVDDLNANLGLKYNVVRMGSIASGEALLAYRLELGLPTLMCLWDPHPMITKYQLARVALPQYSARLYKKGLSDFPADVILKVEAAHFPAYAPRAHLLFTRFAVDNEALTTMMARALDGATHPQAACAWLKDPESQDSWRHWIPPLDFECAAGERMSSAEGDGAARLCELCPAGLFSQGGHAAECRPCSPGNAVALAGLRLKDRLEPPACLGHSFRDCRCMMTFLCIGYFQSEEGQFGCISCDSLGDFFQQSQGQTSCQACLTGAQRYIGVLDGANKSSCQCKAGAPPTGPAGSKLTSKSSSFTGFYNPRRKAGEVCHKDVWPAGR